MVSLANFDLGVIKKRRRRIIRRVNRIIHSKHMATKLHSRPSRFYKLRINNSLSQKTKKKTLA